MIMHFIGPAIFIINLALIAYVVWTIYSQYRLTTGTTRQRLLKAAEDSATILWAKFCVLVGALAGGLAQLADYLGDPSVGTAIQSVLKPEYVAAFTVVVAFITIWARKRTL